MSALPAALRLCSRLPVFPLRADKRPACKRGFLDATRDPEALVKIWGNAPLIGVPTGAVSGFDVLDVDPRHGGDQWLSYADADLPVTRRHATRSGGVHLLFRHAEGVKNTASKIAPGVDTRGDGGYIVHWPADGLPVTNPRIVEEWPKWLLLILMPPRPRAPPFKPASRAEADTRASLMIERAYERVRNAAPGQRHYMIRAAAATLGGLERFLDRGRGQTCDELVSLIMATGGESADSALKTALWAMEKGSRSPLLQSRG